MDKQEEQAAPGGLAYIRDLQAAGRITAHEAGVLEQYMASPAERAPLEVERVRGWHGAMRQMLADYVLNNAPEDREWKGDETTRRATPALADMEAWLAALASPSLAAPQPQGDAPRTVSGQLRELLELNQTGVFELPRLRNLLSNAAAGLEDADRTIARLRAAPQEPQGERVRLEDFFEGDESPEFKEGVRDCLAGKDGNANPYPYDTREHDDWHEGWSDGGIWFQIASAALSSGTPTQGEPRGNHTYPPGMGPFDQFVNVCAPTPTGDAGHGAAPEIHVYRHPDDAPPTPETEEALATMVQLVDRRDIAAELAAAGEGDCPECGGVTTDLYGGDGNVLAPPVGVCCTNCDWLEYDEPEPLPPATIAGHLKACAVAADLWAH